MNETELVQAWSSLEPSSRRRARIETRVLEWIEATETSIAGEWLGLLRVAPLPALVYASVGGVSLVLMTPVGWIVAVLVP